MAKPKLAKRFLLKLPTNQKSIIVASFGRAGSTLLFKSLVSGMAKTRFGLNIPLTRAAVKEGAFNERPNMHLNGLIYKTHNYPSMLKGWENVKVVFIFGDALEAALSAHLQGTTQSAKFFAAHFKHLERENRHSEIFDKDVLGIQSQCNSWFGTELAPVLCVRFETLWDNIDVVSDFAGFSVKLPKRKQRVPKIIDDELMERAKSTYEPINEALAKMPDHFIANPKYAQQFST